MTQGTLHQLTASTTDTTDLHCKVTDTA